MKCHLATLIGFATLLVSPLTVTAQEASEKTAQPVDLLHQAIDRLSQQKTIQADLHQRVEMFGKTLIVAGRYLKGAEDLQMRLDLNVQIPRTVTDATGATSLLLLVDGRRLTMRESILGATQDLTIDVKAVLDVLVEQKKENLRTVLIDLLGVGGLPQLLRGLEDTMDPEQWVRLPSAEESFAEESGHSVYVLQGRWRKQLLDPGSTAEQGDAQPSGAEQAGRQPAPRIPPYVPTHVVLYLDRQTGLPHRIEYQHHDSRLKQAKAVFVLECRDAKFGEEVPPENFISQVQPQAIDLTADWVDRLRSEPEFMARLEQAFETKSSPLSLIIPELMPEPPGSPFGATAP
jgi:hypothetical protein